jgi:hypothetical protein
VKSTFVSLIMFWIIQSIVLENTVTYPFLKPNILDVKLGTILHDETASPKKVGWMKKTAEDTTSFETGVRLTELQVCLHFLILTTLIVQKL